MGDDDTTAVEPTAGPGPVWFAGDLGDPWVAAIADALAAGLTVPVRRISCPGPLADGTWTIDATAPPACLVLHRATVTRADAERLARLRALRHPPTRVVLCVGPHVRHADLERWAGLFDAVVPEATAAVQVARLTVESTGVVVDPPRASRTHVAIVSTNGSMRAMLVEAVGALGHEATEARTWDDAPPRGPAVWDVPVLEPGWAEALAEQAAARPVAVLLGFADRALVARARDHGAIACLDLPFDLADLSAVLGRLTAAATGPGPNAATAPGRRNEPGHAMPPPPTRRRPREAHARDGGPTT